MKKIAVKEADRIRLVGWLIFFCVLLELLLEKRGDWIYISNELVTGLLLYLLSLSLQSSKGVSDYFMGIVLSLVVWIVRLFFWQFLMMMMIDLGWFLMQVHIEGS